MKKSLVRVAGGIFVAALIGVMCWTAPSSAVLAAPAPQATDTPMPGMSPSPMPQETAMPEATTAPMPETTAAPGTGTAPAAGTDMLNNNPNGPAWLSKSARNPGPATSGSMRRRTMPHRVRMMRPRPRVTPPAS